MHHIFEWVCMGLCILKYRLKCHYIHKKSLSGGNFGPVEWFSYKFEVSFWNTADKGFESNHLKKVRSNLNFFYKICLVDSQANILFLLNNNHWYFNYWITKRCSVDINQNKIHSREYWCWWMGKNKQNEILHKILWISVVIRCIFYFRWLSDHCTGYREGNSTSALWPFISTTQWQRSSCCVV